MTANARFYYYGFTYRFSFAEGRQGRGVRVGVLTT
jgi:hypothetical protein